MTLPHCLGAEAFKQLSNSDIPDVFSKPVALTAQFDGSGKTKPVKGVPSISLFGWEKQLQTFCTTAEQSSLLRYKQHCGMWYLSIQHRALLWKHPCKYLPTCLLCCYSSHPRIVSFFFFLRPSLVFVTHNSQWKPQFSLSLIPLFFPHILLCTKGAARFSESSACVCVCVCE